MKKVHREPDLIRKYNNNENSCMEKTALFNLKYINIQDTFKGQLLLTINHGSFLIVPM